MSDNTPKNIQINLTIGERQYPMTISADEEEMVRLAGNLIRKKFVEYKNLYSRSEAIDHLAIVAFDFCMETLQNKSDDTDYLNASSELSELDELLTVYLHQLK
ncbi:MAG: cell division protein ZapA [Chitinophagales bacterium]|nr:cell division protein ZapA [Bacteroidota bacterium]MCB9043341.1 cell division protein ZapA [Chitinophagales bacterium]